MKTAISLPDETFERVKERAAALHLSRSEFFARAAELYLDRLQASSVTDEIDGVLVRPRAIREGPRLLPACVG